MAERKKSISTHKLTLRQLHIDDYEAVKEIMDLVYSNLGGSFRAILNKFPEGQICIEDKGKIIAGALSVIVDYSKHGDKHSYEDITNKGTFSAHTDEGDTLYGIDVFVHPEYRNLRLGRRLYDAR